MMNHQFDIYRAGAGEDFSLFLSSEGKVWSCGNGAFGALGHGDWSDCYEPKIIGIKIIIENFKSCCLFFLNCLF